MQARIPSKVLHVFAVIDINFFCSINVGFFVIRLNKSKTYR